MSNAAKAGKGGGARKYDRNRTWCAAYRSRKQGEQNKLRRVLRHVKRNGSCKDTTRVINKLSAALDNITVKRIYNEVGLPY